MNKNMIILGLSLVGTAAAGMAMAGAPQQAHHASRMHSPAALLKAERAAMAPFKNMAGVWRGTAHMTLPSGQNTPLPRPSGWGRFWAAP